MSAAPGRAAARHDTWCLVLRGLTVVGLVVDAGIHLHLAPVYQEANPQGVGAGNLFRAQALFALGAAAYLVLRGGRGAHVTALLAASAALGAVVLYRYVDLPAVGPLPAMYEPVWFAEKGLSAAAEAVAVLAAGAGLARMHRRRGVLGSR